MYKAKSPRASVRSMPLSIKPLAAAIVMLAVASQVHAVVNGGMVAAGAAAISTNGTTTTIHQSTDRVVINWKSFDIAANETVNINQPALASAILNRVNSSTGTRIDGELNANGRVFVVNPNGIVVGQSGKINANGVVLSTLNVSDANFMEKPNSQYGNALNFRRFVSTPEARVVNDGAIASAEGGISLFGSQVINSATGTLNAKGAENTASYLPYVNANTVNLVAADSIDATQGYSDRSNNIGGGGLIANVTPDLPNNGSNIAANDGVIVVNAGRVLLQAANNQIVATDAIRNTGSIDVASYAYNNSQYDYLNSVELRTGYVGTISTGPHSSRPYRGGGGSMFVGGVINAPGYIGLYTDQGTLTVAGAVTGSGLYGTVDIAELSGSNTIGISAGANVFGESKVNIGYQYADAHDGAITVDGKVTSRGYTSIYGDNVKVRPGSVVAPYYYLNVNPYHYY